MRISFIRVRSHFCHSSLPSRTLLSTQTILPRPDVFQTYGTNALPSNRSTRSNRKRKVQELGSLDCDVGTSKHSPKESADAGDLWTPQEDDDTGGSQKSAPCYVPPDSSDEVDELHAFNFRGDDSRKKVLQFKITARIVPLSVKNIKRNVDVEAANKAAKGYTHNWSLKFSPLNDDTLNLIDRIVVYLHPTCEEQFVVLKFSKKKRFADVSQYGWGSFKVRLMYHFIYPELNRPVEQIFDLDFIVNQISGFERIARISVCDLEKDAIDRLRALHTDEKHAISSSEIEEDISHKKSRKKFKLFEDEECMGDGICFDDFFSDNNIESNPYSGVLFSSESSPDTPFNYQASSSLTDELLDQSLNEFSQPSSLTSSIRVGKKSQSTSSQSDTISNLPSTIIPKSPPKFSFSSSYPHSSQSSIIECSSPYESQSDDLALDLQSPNLLESFSDAIKTQNASNQNSDTCSSARTSINNTSSEILECSAMSNIPQNSKLGENLTSSSELLNPSFSSHQTSTELDCRVNSKKSPSLLKKVIVSEEKTLSNISGSSLSNQKLDHALSVNTRVPSNNSSIKPVFVQTLAEKFDGKILIKQDGKSKLIRIIKSGSTSLLKKSQNSISISKPIPESSIIPAPNKKSAKIESCDSDYNSKGELSQKIEKVRQAIHGMKFEEALIYCLKNYPIVTKEAESKIFKQLHPYAAKSNEEFLSWKFGKRAASMTKHARFIHSLLIETCRGEPWSWVQVRQYVKYHGYAPVAKINGVNNSRFCKQTVNKTSLTCMKQLPNIAELRKLQSQMEEDSYEIDVDDSIQPNSFDSEIGSTLSIRINDRTVEDFTTTEDYELFRWIMKTNEMFNVSTNNDFVPEILMSVFKSFAEYILRRSLSSMMTRKRRHNIIREKDVLTSVLLTEKLQILTEQSLGKKPVKCNIHSY